MTIAIQPDSANIEVTTRGDTPSCIVNTHTDPPFVFFSSIKNDLSSKNFMAISMTGTVKATKAQADTINTWEIGFIQVFSSPFDTYYFAGPENSDGSMIIDRSIGASLLDSEQKFSPFQTPLRAEERPDAQQKTQSPTSIVITAKGYDNPDAHMVLELTNFRTKKTNYLVRVRRGYDVVTAFVARDRTDKGKPYQILAHFAWHGFWAFNFMRTIVTDPIIIINDPIVTNVVSYFRADQVIKGAPTDSKIAQQIMRASKHDKLYNDVGREQIPRVINATANNDLVKAFTQWHPEMGAGRLFFRS